MSLRFTNTAILPRKQQRIRISRLEMLGVTIAMIIVFTLLWKFHADNWAYPIAFYAVSLVGFLIRTLRLVSQR
jgi:hypothetical protein